MATNGLKMSYKIIQKQQKIGFDQNLEVGEWLVECIPQPKKIFEGLTIIK
jgi:hypothetical protein